MKRLILKRCKCTSWVELHKVICRKQFASSTEKINWSLVGCGLNEQFLSRVSLRSSQEPGRMRNYLIPLHESPSRPTIPAPTLQTTWSQNTVNVVLFILKIFIPKIFKWIMLKKHSIISK